jgi:uncharacterized protein (DUF2132 family)
MNLRMTRWARWTVGSFYVLSASRSLPASQWCGMGLPRMLLRTAASSVGTAYKNLPRLYNTVEV